MNVNVSIRNRKEDCLSTDQGACRVQSIRQHETDQPGVHTRCDKRTDRQHSSDEDDAGTDKLESNRQPAVNRDTGKVADLVSIYSVLVVGEKDRLLRESADG